VFNVYWMPFCVLYKGSCLPCRVGEKVMYMKNSIFFKVLEHRKQNKVLYYIEIEDSICGFFAPLFTPIGLNNSVIVCALLFGIIAKEAAVSVLLFFPEIIQALSLPVVLSLVIFFTLYPKCLAAQTAINHHCGRKTGVKVFFLNLLLAYSLSFVVYILCDLII